MSAEIFISYATRDREVAQTLCEALEYRGFGCWIASRDIGPGENFQVSIVRAIRAAKVMILVFSANSNNSEEIKKELVLAGQSRLIAIPVRVEDVTPDEAFAYELAIRQWIDLFDDWEHAVQRLVVHLEAIVGVKRTLLLEPAPPPPQAAPSAELAGIVQAAGASTGKPIFSPAAEIAQAQAAMPAAASEFTLAEAQDEADSSSATLCAEAIGEAGAAPTSPAPGAASPATETNTFACSEAVNGTRVPRPPKTASRRLVAPAAIALLLVGGGGAGFWAYSEYQRHAVELARGAQMAQENLAAERAEAEQRATEAARQKAALEAEMRAVAQARQQAEADRQAAEQKAALEAEKRAVGQSGQQPEAERQLESLQRLTDGQQKTMNPARQAALAPAKPVKTPPPPEYYGAIAWDAGTGKWGFSWNQATEQRADDVALGQCGATGCKVILRPGRATCASLATTEDGKHAGAAWRRDPEAARLAALANCQKDKAGECTVRVAACNK